LGHSKLVFVAILSQIGAGRPGELPLGNSLLLPLGHHRFARFRCDQVSDFLVFFVLTENFCFREEISEGSFKALNGWLKEVKDEAPDEMSIILVANKCDLVGE
jgi:Ras family